MIRRRTGFVTLLNARADDQALLREHFGPRFGGGRILGNRRFVDLRAARQYFEALCQIPKFAAEIERAQKVRADRKERLATQQATLKMYSSPPVKPEQNPQSCPIQKRNAAGRVKYRGTPTPFLDRETFDPPEAFAGQFEGSSSDPQGEEPK